MRPHTSQPTCVQTTKLAAGGWREHELHHMAAVQGRSSEPLAPFVDVQAALAVPSKVTVMVLPSPSLYATLPPAAGQAPWQRVSTVARVAGGTVSLSAVAPMPQLP